MAKKTPVRDVSGLKVLGNQKTLYKDQYSPEVLERFENRHPTQEAWTSFICPEFTSLCPKTGQPDFAKIYINYVAADWMVESKSLKLYMFSFRNHGDFHEDCVAKICNDLSKLLAPRYLEVIGEFTARGGIAIFPFVQATNKEKKYLELAKERFQNYGPGKYSLSNLGR